MTDYVVALLFDQAAALLSRHHGAWTVEEHRVRGPGTLAVRARYHAGTRYAHIDLGLALDDGDEGSVVWGCAEEYGSDLKIVTAEDAARAWVDSVAVPALQGRARSK